ncbi:MAG: hypothetical protein PHR77_12170 [Kiritimatiellae bacterium]|nr:hypothetical protein [Kiritimatiellia bacterium]MDD5519504.1 hypothetical protein [Kiritimatiellia bacterium]
MEFLNARHKNHLRRKLKLLAAKEADEVLRKLKKLYPQLKPMSIVYEDVPTTDMLKSDIKIESEFAYDNDKQELTFFLFNIYMLVENDAQDFRRRIRGAILKECGDIVGEDLEEGD